MAFQSVPNTAEAVVNMTLLQIPAVMTFYAAYASGYGEAELDALAANMNQWAVTRLKPALSNQNSYDGVTVRGLENINDILSINTSGAGAGGAAGGDAMPNSAALAVTRYTAYTGRSARGRVFFPLRIANMNTDRNYVLAASADDIVTWLEEVSGYMATGQGDEVIVSRFANGTKRATGITFPVVGYRYSDLRVDSQRGRLPTGT